VPWVRLSAAGLGMRLVWVAAGVARQMANRVGMREKRFTAERWRCSCHGGVYRGQSAPEGVVDSGRSATFAAP
jgi:hypothetical protein